MSNVPSENILKLIELTDKIYIEDNNRDYKAVVVKLKEIMLQVDLDEVTSKFVSELFDLIK